MTLSDGEVALAAAEAGAAVVRLRYGTDVARHAKVGTDFATDADLESEEVIRAVLTRHCPDDAQLGEEGGASGAADAPRRWLVDPLCGTMNFAATVPLVAVNVALAAAGRIVAAAVAEPLSGEVYWSDQHRAAARCDGKDARLTPTGRSLLVDLNVDGQLLQRRLTIELMARTEFRQRFQPRVASSSIALAWVAAGRHAAYVTEGAGDLTESVHFAAGIGLCQAAGCEVTDLDGVPLGSTDGSSRGGLIAAADAETHRPLLALLRG
jgi:myo-inositol-1(or 4)-monophosphatase